MSDDQLQPEDTLDDRGVDDVLDEGYSPPDREPHHLEHPEGGESLDERLAAEEDEVWDDPGETGTPDPDAQVGDDRTGRLAGASDGTHEGNDLYAEDEGIDGAGASAEEAAVHTLDE